VVAEPRYRVERADGRDGPGHKHQGCEYFVLDLTHDPVGRAAALTYAAATDETELAAALVGQVGRLSGEQA
jgi:hypothetical protein